MYTKSSNGINKRRNGQYLYIKGNKVERKGNRKVETYRIKDRPLIKCL